VKIIVDRDSCEGNALCVRAAPEVFRVDEEDYVEVLVAEPGPELATQVREAVRRCPKGALRVED
jgi:ferredoxin